MTTHDDTRTFWLAAGFALAACVSLWIDVPIARYAEMNWMQGDIGKLLDISEVFAHGFGVLLILTTVAVLDPQNRPRLPRIAACVYGAGLIVQVVKHLVPRVRPNAFGASGDVFHTFLPWSTVTDGDVVVLGGRAIQSFPSGHTATAVALAFALAWVYPRGRWLFACFAVLAAGQRVESGAHFVSDALAGAAVGCLTAGLFLGNRGMGPWFARREVGLWRSEVGDCHSNSCA